MGKCFCELFMKKNENEIIINRFRILPQKCLAFRFFELIDQRRLFSMNWLFESLISTSLISTDLMIWLVYHTLWGRKQRRKTWLVRTQALQILWDSVYILYARIHQFLPPLMVAIKVWKMPKRKVCLSHLGDNKKCLLGISVSNKYIPHKSISEESKVNPKCIN